MGKWTSNNIPDQKGKNAITTASHPGWTATDLQRHTGLFRFLNPVFGQKPNMGALPSLFAALGHDIKGGDYIGPGGFGEMKGYPKKVKASARAHTKP